MATNTRKLASLLGASGAGIANDGTLTSAAIGEVIVAADIAAGAVGSSEIAADAVGTTELANDVAISTTGAIAGTGGLTIDGATIFNETSADVDFRVESNGQTHMLFVDGGTNSIGICDSTPDDKLCIGDTATGGQIHKLKMQSATVTTTLIVDDDTGFSELNCSHHCRFTGAGLSTRHEIGRFQGPTTGGGVDRSYMRFLPDSYLMINWSSFTPIPLVVMDDDNTTRNFAVDRNSTGIYMFGTWQTSMSDERLKKDISSLNNILPELEKLNPVDFKWKQKELFPATYYVEGDELPEGMSVGDIKEPAEERKKDEEKHYGLLAQEVKEVFPTLIYKPIDQDQDDDDIMLNVRKDELVYIAIQAIKELSAKVTALENA